MTAARKVVESLKGHELCKAKTSDQRPFVAAQSSRMLEQVLIQDQHGSTLNTCPDKAGANPSEPACNSFGLIDVSKTDQDR